MSNISKISAHIKQIIKKKKHKYVKSYLQVVIWATEQIYRVLR